MWQLRGRAGGYTGTQSGGSWRPEYDYISVYLYYRVLNGLIKGLRPHYYQFLRYTQIWPDMTPRMTQNDTQNDPPGHLPRVVPR